MSAFTEAVERNLEGLGPVATGPARGCVECGWPGDEELGDDDWYDYANEPHFVRGASCDSCGSTLGGNRYPAHAWPEDADVFTDEYLHLNICTDCVLYHANGDEPERWDG